jgi:hypothetical protein
MKKTLLIAVASLALFATPALAQMQLAQNSTKSQASKKKTPPRLFVGQGITEGNNVYDCTGKYLGSDPDPAVRAQILKSEGDECSMR